METGARFADGDPPSRPTDFADSLPLEARWRTKRPTFIFCLTEDSLVYISVAKFRIDKRAYKPCLLSDLEARGRIGWLVNSS